MTIALLILAVVAAQAATYLARTRLVLTTKARHSNALGSAYLDGVHAGLRMAPLVRDLAEAEERAFLFGTTPNQYLGDDERLHAPIDEAQAAEALADEDPLVEVEIVIQGESCFQTIPSSTRGRDVLDGALRALDYDPLIDSDHFGYQDAEGVEIGLGADAGTLALMPQPFYFRRSGDEA